MVSGELVLVIIPFSPYAKLDLIQALNLIKSMTNKTLVIGLGFGLGLGLRFMGEHGIITLVFYRQGGPCLKP